MATMINTIIYAYLNQRIIGILLFLRRTFMEKEKLWTKDFINITIISFFIFLVFYVLIASLPLYLVENLNAGADKAGLLTTLFLAAAIVIRPLAGKWVEKGSQKKILIYSTIAFCIASSLYLFTKSLGAILVLRIFHGLTFGIITTVKGTISAELIPASRRGEGVSYFSLAMGVAMVFGPVIGLNLANHNMYTLSIILCIIFAAINILLALVINVPKLEPVTKIEKRGFSWNDIMDGKTIPYAIPTFLLATSYSCVSAFLAIYAKELNLVAAASTFFIVYAIFMIIFRPFTGKYSDMYGPKIIVIPCILIFAIGMFILQLPLTGFLMIIAGILIGIGYGSVTPVFQSQIISSVERHRVGIANSVFFNAMDLGMAVGSFILGIVASNAGYSRMYLVAMGIIIVTFFIYIGITKEKRRQ
ncbi:MFS transporter [Rummeliibacillus sp. TYF005]|nr:MFS transporter [Rummeliibacillus sp. TYF005]